MEAEIILQANSWRWHWNTFPGERGWLRRVKNECDNHPRKTQLDFKKQLSENKATGVVAGTWDMFYMRDPFIWIEFKVTTGLTDAQIEFMIRGQDIGHHFFVVKSIEQFQKLIYEIRNSQIRT